MNILNQYVKKRLVNLVILLIKTLKEVKIMSKVTKSEIIRCLCCYKVYNLGYDLKNYREMQSVMSVI